LTEYQRACSEHDVARIGIVGTSALRDAAGAPEFRKRVGALFGTDLHVISGDAEAQLTFAGATSGLSLSGRVFVFDVGGGSTEVVSGVVAERAEAERFASVDIGSVRLLERCVQNDPPHADELEAVRRTVREALAQAPRPEPGAQAVGVAGTVTTLVAIEQELTRYDSARVHGATLTAARVGALAARLASLPLAERRDLPGLEPARADVIVVGALIVQELLDWAKAPSMIASDRGVRWGVLARLGQGLDPVPA
jgi:exopolyphosphatase/guanosine-5'-triphosphate,3'-diphosphate pyrophosphatase